MSLSDTWKAIPQFLATIYRKDTAKYRKDKTKSMSGNKRQAI
jgi:hypothetical protein